MYQIGDEIYLERFDSNGIPEKTEILDVITTKSGKVYIEVKEGLISFNYKFGGILMAEEANKAYRFLYKRVENQ